jgi:hypothetical protein
MTRDIQAPGADWLGIISRKSREDFAKAFVRQPVLEALILRTPRIGIDAIRDYFETSHRLFEQIAFVREARAPERVFLEWEGRFSGKAISGITILSLAEDGRIARIRIHHYPQEQASAFAHALDNQENAS